MATQGERRALMFLAVVALLGAGTRAIRARRSPTTDSGIDQQIAAVDSAGPRRKQFRQSGNRPTRQPVDLDAASADEIERLPGIGPSLAKRIVADRTAHGPFGCLLALDRVKGVGPGLLARLDSLATFSAAGAGPCASPERAPAGRPPR
jgi:competence protein ComEA